MNGKRVQAHRFSYELAGGVIPKGMILDHLCRNQICVRPSHLQPVTHRVNVLRGVGPAARQARQTRCLRDHPFSGDNLIVRKNGKRECRACKRANAKEWSWRNQAKINRQKREKYQLTKAG